jgi:hypothetical protein
VPRGLGLRLLAWLRVLMPYWKKGGIDLDVSPFTGFDKASYRLPEELYPIFGAWKELPDLDQAVRAMQFRHPLEDDDVWTLRIEPMLGLAALYIVLHEGAHVAQRHFELRQVIDAGTRLDEFGLTPLDAQRSLEIDADRVAAVWTAHAVADMAAGPGGSAVAAELALHCGYVWVALLALYDHHLKLFDDFAAQRYPRRRFATGSWRVTRSSSCGSGMAGLPRPGSRMKTAAGSRRCRRSRGQRSIIAVLGRT